MKEKELAEVKKPSSTLLTNSPFCHAVFMTVSGSYFSRPRRKDGVTMQSFLIPKSFRCAPQKESPIKSVKFQ